MAHITINEGLAWLKTLKKRHEELLALRNDNAHRERRFYGAAADREIVKEPVYDVKALDFDVQIQRLPAGDYLIEDTVLVERKTCADFALSLVDGRLFPQAAALTRRPERTILLLEGPRPVRMPDVHPHALQGALVSLAAMWRLPVVHARDPEESLLALRFLAQQARRAGGVLKRYDRRPKRLASRKLYVLQGLPGIGPGLARRLLARFGSVERVITANPAALMQVRGVGRTKAVRIRELVS
jgi:ERCC4-type nuclease